MNPGEPDFGRRRVDRRIDLRKEFPRVFDRNRLADLAAYRIVGTGDEKVFDDIVRTAADVCAAPMAFLTFLDGQRQWIKASFGAARGETTLDRAICAAAVESNGLFVVADCDADPRVNWSPAVYGEPPIAFYAGAIVRSPLDQPIGTLCVADVKPRVEGLSPERCEALTSLANDVMAALEARRRLSKE